jgi:hypothetical protein
VLDTLDFWIGTVAIFVLAGVEVVCFGWILGIDRGLAEAHRGAHLKIPRIYRVVIKYVAPAYLAAAFIGFCVQSLPEYLHALARRPVAALTIGMILVIFLGLVGAARRAERRLHALADTTGAADRDGRGEGAP